MSKSDKDIELMVKTDYGNILGGFFFEIFRSIRK